MSTVRINDKIKKEVTPILSDLGISLSEAINMFLHQVKINNGIPFDLKLKKPTELNDGKGSYMCEDGQIHSYGEKELEKAKKEAKKSKGYKSAKEMIEDIIREEWFMYIIKTATRFKQSLKRVYKRRLWFETYRICGWYTFK